MKKICFRLLKEASIVISALTCMVSCGSENEKKVDLSQIPLETLECSVVTLGHELMMPMWVTMTESGIGIYDESDKNGLLHFYRTPGYEYAGSFGRAGKSSKEFIMPRICQSGSHAVLMSYDGKYAEVSYADSISTDWGKVNAGESGKGLRFIALLKDGGQAISSDYAEHELVFIDKEGNSSPYDNYPEALTTGLDRTGKSVVWEPSFACSPDGVYIFGAVGKYPVAEVLSVNSRKCRRSELQTDFHNEYTMKDGMPLYNHPVQCYSQAYASDKYFYALYHGVKSSETMTTAPELHQYDHACRLVRRIRLCPGAYSFAVSTSDSTIYVLHINADHVPELCRYDIH